MKSADKIRVLHVIGSMNCGGAEMMLMNLYRKIDRSKVQFDFVEHTDKDALYDAEIMRLGGEIYQCPRFVGNNYLIYKKWWEDFFETNGERYTIVHGHIGSTAAIYLKCAKKYGKYTIVHSHNTKGSWSMKEAMYRLLARGVIGVADEFFACSRAAGIDRFGGNRKFKVLNNAIDTKKYIYSDEIRKQVRSELGIRDEYVIGHVGRFNYQKNHQFLIDIFSELNKDQNSDVKLLLVGDGEEVDAIKSKVERLKLKKDVIFTGIRSDVNRLLQAMDVFVFPSLFEGLPVSIVEAQAAGLPCVISNKVPDECIITDGLVTIVDLAEAAKIWAKHIRDRKNVVRRDTSSEIKANGFDITETAKWLEGYYIEHGK